MKAPRMNKATRKLAQQCQAEDIASMPSDSSKLFGHTIIIGTDKPNPEFNTLMALLGDLPEDQQRASMVHAKTGTLKVMLISL